MRRERAHRRSDRAIPKHRQLSWNNVEKCSVPLSVGSFPKLRNESSPLLLPTLADCFKGAFRGAQWTAATLPTVHCYSFLKGTETPEELKLRAEGHLGGPIPDETWRIVIVRDVAPNKARAPGCS